MFIVYVDKCHALCYFLNMKKINSQMKILLVLNKSYGNHFRVIVKLEEKWVRKRVDELLQEAKDKEAFELILAKAHVESYLPPGKRPSQRPQVTLFEDMLS